MRAIAAQAPAARAADAPPVASAYAPVAALIETPSLTFNGFERPRRSRAAAQAEADVEGVALAVDQGEPDAAPPNMATAPVSARRLSEMEARAARFRDGAE